MLSTVAVYPLDVVRTHLQSQIMNTQGKIYAGAGDCVRSLIKTPYPRLPRWAEGRSALVFVRGALNSTGVNFLPLYKGLLLPLGAQVIYKSPIFTVHTNLMGLDWGKWTERSPLLKTSAAGTTAGAVNALVWVTPVEVSASSTSGSAAKISDLLGCTARRLSLFLPRGARL